MTKMFGRAVGGSTRAPAFGITESVPSNRAQVASSRFNRIEAPTELPPKDIPSVKVRRVKRKRRNRQHSRPSVTLAGPFPRELL